MAVRTGILAEGTPLGPGRHADVPIGDHGDELRIAVALEHDRHAAAVVVPHDLGCAGEGVVGAARPDCPGHELLDLHGYPSFQATRSLPLWRSSRRATRPSPIDLRSRTGNRRRRAAALQRSESRGETPPDANAADAARGAPPPRPLAPAPGPFCSTLLADLGMDVLTVTAPGDPFGAGIPFLGAQQAEHDAQPEGRRRPRDLPPARRRRRRRARGLPSRRHARASASTTTTLRAINPRLDLLLDLGLRAGRAVPRRGSGTTSTTSRYAGVLEFIGARPGARRSSPACRSPTSAAGALMAAIGILSAVIARGTTGRGPARRRRDARRRVRVERLPSTALRSCRRSLAGARPRAAHRPLPLLRRLRDARRSPPHDRRLRGALLGRRSAATSAART